jgi:hypothetical protein
MFKDTVNRICQFCDFSCETCSGKKILYFIKIWNQNDIENIICFLIHSPIKK